nr:MAG TPA: ribonucleotide-diphosphate reductase subunit alpha [Caudoviricetes sp.]
MEDQPHQLFVKKRSGKIEILDITKIQKQTEAACSNLKNVSQSELELDAQLSFTNLISTADLQATLIKTAVDKIDVDRPDWTFVAARLFLFDLYHRVVQNYKKRGYTTFPLSLSEYIEVGIAEGRLYPDLAVGYDLKDLNNYIETSRDLQFTYMGIKTLYDRYLVKDRNNDPIELPQHMFMGIAMFLAQNEKDKQQKAKDFYDVMSKFEVMPATPTLSNARTVKHQLSSCFVGSAHDSIEGIMDSLREQAILSKFGGGIGWDWSNIRATGSDIRGYKGASSGLIPFMKINNDLMIAVDQLSVRKGAAAVYLESWHKDVYDFIDLKKNSGEERRRAHDLFPALWINDLFMERIEFDRDWSLFDPHEAKGLTSLYGDDFNKKYIEYENDPNISRITVKARHLWKAILTNYYESGSPFLAFKDTANAKNPNNHAGLIRSSNLCTEVYINTEPDQYKTRIIYYDAEGSRHYVDYDEQKLVKVENKEGHISSKPAKSVTSLDSNFYATEQVRINGKTAVCNLASINLSKINTTEDIERVVPIAIRMLDNVIDLNYYPLEKIRLSAEKDRAIGLGVMGEAEYLATHQIMFGTPEHYKEIDRIMSDVSYNAILVSSNLAKERGSYPQFKGSKWSKGIFPIDMANTLARTLTPPHEQDWDKLREHVKQNGMRNGYLMAIAPTSTISILVGTTQAIEPVYKRKWYEDNLSGLTPVVVPHLSPDTWQYYIPAYDLDQMCLVEAAAVRQKYIDQGQSLNIFMNPKKAKGSYLSALYRRAHALGLKSTYYLRSESPDEADVNVADRTIECQGCQ